MHIIGDDRRLLHQQIFLTFSRGTTGSYQLWADRVGDESFEFENLLPFFERSPTFTPPNYSKRGQESEILFDPQAFSPKGGPLEVSYTNFYQQFSPFIKRALTSLGLAEIPGFNSGKLLGFSELTSTIDPHAGTRSSSETSFLQQAIANSNLQVYQRTLVKDIIFDEKNNAVGVNVNTAGKIYSLSAAREVIVAAGAVSVSRLTILGLSLSLYSFGPLRYSWCLALDPLTS